MNLTLLIPTKNRYFILKKTLSYYIENKFSFKILILDSSDKKNFELNNKFIKKIKNIKQYKINGWTTEVLKKSKKYIKTDYVTYSGDDDVICVRNLKYFIDFLEKNKNYIGAHGQAITADYTKGYLNYTTQYKFKEINSNTPVERLDEFFKNYTTLMFAITRKFYFFKAMDLVPNKKNRFKCPDKGISTEVVPCAGLAFYGKFKNLNIPHLVRIVGHNRTFLKKKIDDKSLKYLITIFKKKFLDKSSLKFFEKKIEKNIVNKYKKIDQKRKNNLAINFFKLILTHLYLKNLLKKILIFFNQDIFSKEYIFSSKKRKYIDFKLILKSLETK